MIGSIAGWVMACNIMVVVSQIVITMGICIPSFLLRINPIMSNPPDEPLLLRIIVTPKPSNSPAIIHDIGEGKRLIFIWIREKKSRNNGNKILTARVLSVNSKPSIISDIISKMVFNINTHTESDNGSILHIALANPVTPAEQ